MPYHIKNLQTGEQYDATFYYLIEPGGVFNYDSPLPSIRSIINLSDRNFGTSFTSTPIVKIIEGVKNKDGMYCKFICNSPSNQEVEYEFWNGSYPER